MRPGVFLAEAGEEGVTGRENVELRGSDTWGPKTLRDKSRSGENSPDINGGGTEEFVAERMRGASDGKR